MINITNVTKKYGSLTAVDNISLEIKDNEIFGFLGPNGAGKSTTLKMTTGIIPIDSGDIRINNISIKDNPIEAKRQFAFIPDDPNIFLRLKGIEYLKFLASIYKIDNTIALERIKQYSKEFGMENSLSDYISSYSHGMRQKILIIGVLMISPKNWILDEPMTGLDPNSSHILKQKMREHADNGNSVIFSTHVLEVAEKICDRVGIINKGKLLFVGTLDELKKQSGTDDSLESIFLELTKWVKYYL